MTIRGLRPMLGGAAIVAAAGILAGGLALRPAFAIGGAAEVGPFTVTHCTSSSPCQSYSNQGMGVGVEGVNSNKSTNGAGIEGDATGGGVGVVGEATSNIAVGGVSVTNDGVYGESNTGTGLYGLSSGGNGLFAESDDGNGGFLVSKENGAALLAEGYGGYAIWAIGETSSPAIEAEGNSTGDGIDVTNDSASGYAIFADNQATEGGYGAEVYGYDIGEIDASNTTPWTAENQDGTVEDYTDASGDFYYYGKLTQESKIRNGLVVREYTPTSTTPTVEDNGTAHLVDGIAIVRLDSVFADAIDMSRAYQVLLTPDGDTKGLYIASKSPTQFVVREVQGGRGSLDFDYHIYASHAGDAGVHMAEMTQAQLRSVEPHAPAIKLSAKRPKIHTP